MPLYEYLCDACGHRFEQIRKFSDPPLDVCPECGGAVRKLVSSPAIQFKGSGWYVNDYAKKGTSDTAASEAGEAANGDKKTTEKKPAATKDGAASTKTSSGSEAKPSSPAASKPGS